MKIYLIKRTDEFRYDEYDSAVVIAKNYKKAEKYCVKHFDFKIGEISTQFMGYADDSLEKGHVLASFNVG